MKLRIIIASIVLVIILGSWLIYGYIFVNTNPAKILTKLSSKEKDNITNYLDKLDLSKDSYYTITLAKDKNLYLYYNSKDNKLYLYNDKEYCSFNISKDINTYKSITNSLFDSFTHNYKILDKTKKRDSKKNYYVYSYSLNELYPLIKTLKTDKTFIDSLKSINLDSNSLDNYKSNAIGLNIIAKGSKRDIVYFNLKIDNIFDIYKEGDYISGFFLDYSFTYDKELILYTEKNEYHVTITKNNNKFSITNYKNSSLKEILSIIE